MIERTLRVHGRLLPNRISFGQLQAVTKGGWAVRNLERGQRVDVGGLPAREFEGASIWLDRRWLGLPSDQHLLT